MRMTDGIGDFELDANLGWLDARAFPKTTVTITALASAKVAIPNPLQPRVPERSNMCLLKLFQNWHF